MPFASLAYEEAAVEVVDDVRRSPVELRGDRRHVGGGKPGDDETAEIPGKDLLIHEDANVTRFGIFQVRVENDRGERCEDPWPGTEGVVSDVEPESGEHAVAFVLRRKDALGDVAAAAWFGAGIPAGPPIDGEVRAESD